MPEALNAVYGPVREWMKPYLESNGMKRLKQIDMNCGMNHTSFPFFQKLSPYSRFIHSLHTAQTVERFTDERKQILAALFHDIATPAFSHVVDFAKGDYLQQEATEKRTSELIEQDETLALLLKKEGFSIDDVDDYHRYPLADNDSPRLSADRLEYTLGNSCNYGFASLSQLQEIYEDVKKGSNENGEEELVFAHREQAEALGLLSIQCGEIYSSRIDRYGMEMLAEILRQAMAEQILTSDDLYHDEPYVIGILENSGLKKQWIDFTSLHRVEVTGKEAKGARQIAAKKRYIDPIAVSCGRVHQWSETYRKRLNAFLNESQKEWLKGD